MTANHCVRYQSSCVACCYQELLKHYGSTAALGPVPDALHASATAGAGSRESGGSPDTNALLALLPEDSQASARSTQQEHSLNATASDLPSWKPWIVCIPRTSVTFQQRVSIRGLCCLRLASTHHRSATSGLPTRLRRRRADSLFDNCLLGPASYQLSS